MCRIGSGKLRPGPGGGLGTYRPHEDWLRYQIALMSLSTFPPTLSLPPNSPSPLLQFWTGPACPSLWGSSARGVNSVPSAAPAASEGPGAPWPQLPAALEVSVWESW